MKIIHFHELVFSSSDMKKLSDTEAAALMGLAAIADELRVFQNLLTQLEGKMPRDQTLKHVYRVQFFTLFKVHSSKIYEADQLIRSAQSRLRETKSDLSIVFASKSSVLRDLRREKYMKLCEQVRNKASFHFDFRTLEEGIATLDEKGPIEAYISDRSCNTVYCFGDSMLLYSALQGLLEDGQSALKEFQSVTDWIDWTVRYSELVVLLLEDVMVHLLATRFPEKRLQKRHYYCEPEFTYSLKSASLPLFAVT